MAENLGPSRTYLFAFSSLQTNLSHRFFQDDRGAPPFPPAIDTPEVFLNLGSRAARSMISAGHSVDLRGTYKDGYTPTLVIFRSPTSSARAPAFALEPDKAGLVVANFG
jgi:hypothetical protein